MKFSAAIHGDELTGIEMTLRLAELLTGSYGNNAYLTSLVDSMEIWLCPISNPDGYVSGNRGNTHGVDLNRDFPDRFTRPRRRSRRSRAGNAGLYVLRLRPPLRDGRQLPRRGAGGQLSLGRGHGWQRSPAQPHSMPPTMQLFYDFSVGYASRNPLIYNVEFPEGVTRGWEWYQIWGGMQDWAYVWRGEHHVTIELI